jgi:hypothetical protein
MNHFTKDHPTKPGFYWIREVEGSEKTKGWIVEAIVFPGVKDIYVLDFNKFAKDMSPRRGHYEWSGPLSPPD